MASLAIPRTESTRLRSSPVTLRPMPMERLLSNQPFTVSFQQREDLRDAGVEPSQFPRPALHFEVYDRDRFENLYTCETGFNLRCGPVLIDPSEQVLNGSAVLDPETITSYRGLGVKRSAHQVALSRASTCNVEVDRTGDCIVLGQVSVACWTLLPTTAGQRLVRTREF